LGEIDRTCTARVKESWRITPESTDEVRNIVLTVDDPAFRYREGQSIAVVVPGPHPFGNPYHIRRYTIANARPETQADEIDFSIMVRRCFYQDEASGEQYPGIASNFLCDARPGDEVAISGPYATTFEIPSQTDANLVMVGAGTGIAPFRGLIERIYRLHGGWQGQVRLYYGARNGMDLSYQNSVDNDLPEYYAEETFKAISAVATRPLSDDTDALRGGVEDHREEIWGLLQDEKTHLFVCGLEGVGEMFNQVLAERADSLETWSALKEKMQAQQRWHQLLYR